MKSSGLFPHRKARTPTNMYGGSAGKSASNNKPGPSRDGYEEGMVGWRESRQAGGQSMSQKLAGRPIANDAALKGLGGLAVDASAAKYLDDKGRPSDADPTKRKSRW